MDGSRGARGRPRVGAQFDAEVDAFLILVLSVYVARRPARGCWRSARHVTRSSPPGGRCHGCVRRLPPRYWRKVVAATQGIVLTVAAAEVLPPAVTQAALVVALALLAESFGRDVWWLWSHAPRRH